MFPTPRDSGGWVSFGRTTQYGTNPVAMVFWKGNALTNLGAMALNKPTVGDCEQDPSQVIDTGDWIRVDADNGIVEVVKRRTNAKRPTKPRSFQPPNKGPANGFPCSLFAGQR